jgi:vacuolar-type H+-ATPase subunit F/Vma7
VKVFVAGERDDVAGFGLAGVEPLRAEEIDADDAIVILSAGAAESPNRRIDESANRRLFVRLPEP